MQPAESSCSPGFHRDGRSRSSTRAEDAYPGRRGCACPRRQAVDFESKPLPGEGPLQRPPNRLGPCQIRLGSSWNIGLASFGGVSLQPFAGKRRQGNSLPACAGLDKYRLVGNGVFCFPRSTYWMRLVSGGLHPGGGLCFFSSSKRNVTAAWKSGAGPDPAISFQPSAISSQPFHPEGVAGGLC